MSTRLILEYIKFWFPIKILVNFFLMNKKINKRTIKIFPLIARRLQQILILRIKNEQCKKLAFHFQQGKNNKLHVYMVSLCIENFNLCKKIFIDKFYWPVERSEYVFIIYSETEVKISAYSIRLGFMTDEFLFSKISWFHYIMWLTKIILSKTCQKITSINENIDILSKYKPRHIYYDEPINKLFTKYDFCYAMFTEIDGQNLGYTILRRR